MTTMYVFWVIMGMGAVTYGPRLFPMIVGQRVKFPLWLKTWLEYVPYAVLGALIFPGIMTVDPNRPWIGLIGGITAALIAWTVGNLVIVVAGAIVVVYFLQ